jgi:hypothetical protein
LLPHVLVVRFSGWEQARADPLVDVLILPLAGGANQVVLGEWDGAGAGSHRTTSFDCVICRVTTGAGAKNQEQ